MLGTLLPHLFDLSVGALQVAGGAEVCALGWNLLHYEPRAEDTVPDPQIARQGALERAFYPLTLPVSIDAGVIAVAITLGAHHVLRLSALLVLSIGVQIVWNGVKTMLGEIHIA